MGFRFRKSFKLFPGVKLNLNKKRPSLTFGTRGLKTTISSNGRVSNTIGLPGTGLSYTHYSKSRRKRK